MPSASIRLSISIPPNSPFPVDCGDGGGGDDGNISICGSRFVLKYS